MSKYIRTKEDYIFEEIGNKRYKVTNMGAWKEIKIDFEYGTNPDRILKQADSLEELCDEFVYVFKNQRPSIIDEKEIEKIKTLDLLKYVYAGIWTDKGLIYVAKMNDKGELELL